MKMKKTLSVLCSAAVLLTSVIAGNALFPSQTVRAEEQLAETETEIAAPQNLRYEDGFIVWDEVEDAYGYCLSVTADEPGEDYFTEICYVNRVEMDRLFYEKGCDLGKYSFQVQAFDQQWNMSEWSEPITVEYAPTIDAPANVRVSEEETNTVIWDEVEGAYRYNVRVYSANDPKEIVGSAQLLSDDCRYCLMGDKYEEGDYLITVQTMDKEYNVSPWTEPVLLTYVKEAPAERDCLEAPQNVRLDESGDNIVWDKVEGAGCYMFDVEIEAVREDGEVYREHSFGVETDLGETWLCSYNWKNHFALPYADVKYTFSIIACPSWETDLYESEPSEPLSFTYTMEKDESIEMPEIEGGEGTNFTVKWNGAENRYMYNTLINGSIVGTDYNLPYGEYEVSLFVIDENYHYNHKTYKVTYGLKADESVWVPEVFFKFHYLLWDYDTVRHDETENFWLRIRNAEDGSLVDLDYTRIRTHILILTSIASHQLLIRNSL